MSESKRNSRRDFLKQSLMAATSISPLSMYLSSVAASYIGQSTALAQGIVPSQIMNMFTIYLHGGPARWVWDQALSPNAEVSDLNNPSLITKFGDGASGAPGIYKSVNIDGVYLPYLWSGKIPTPNGSVQMSELAHNMIAVRGVGHLNDGHDNNAAKLISPVAGPTLTGLLSDASSRPLPSVGISGSGRLFKSSRGTSHISVAESGNMLNAALSPFILSSRVTGLDGQLLYDSSVGLPKGISTQTSDVFDQFFKAMSQNSGSLHRYLPTTYQDRKNASKLMLQDFSELSMIYTALSSKYSSLIQRSFHESGLFLSGVDDSPVIGDGGSLFSNLDLTSSTLSGRFRYTGSDLRNAFTTSTSISNLVSSFVLAEYMLTKKYSQSVIGFIAGFQRLTFDQVRSIDNNGNVSSTFLNEVSNYPLDHHFSGARTLLLMNTRFYRAISACLYELITVLKNTDDNLFNRTAINVISEFSRNTMSGGGETGHGFKGVPFSIFNGKIKKAAVIGNIGYEYSNSNPVHSRGLWGAAASMQSMGNRPLNAGNVASTIASIIGVPSPSPNNISLVSVENDEIKPIITERENKT